MLSEPKAKQEIGVAGEQTYTGYLRQDEFLRELKGKRAIKAFREMRDNDSTVGAVMYATEQVLRDNKYKVEASPEDTDGFYKEFVESVFEDMEHCLDDHIAEALSSLTYGFAIFEVVYKRRKGTSSESLKHYSKFDDNLIGVRKLAPRAQWTIQRFDIDTTTGEILGVVQEINWKGKQNYIPMSKVLHYKTTTTNADPSGRSILRNAYTSYKYMTGLQETEAIAIERELHGIPVGRIPVEYFDENATDAQKAVKNKFEQILRDVKFNEQGYILIPSEPYRDNDGKIYDTRLVDIELISSQGNRNIEIDPVIRRYQNDIARSVMAEFLMLGGGSHGSYALSKSKTDLFLRALESYIGAIFDVINRQLLEPLFKLNGFDLKYCPKIIPGDVAPHDLRELGAYLRNLNGADINLSDQTHIIDALLDNADLPTLDRETYDAGIPRGTSGIEQTPQNSQGRQ